MIEFYTSCDFLWVMQSFYMGLFLSILYIFVELNKKRCFCYFTIAVYVWSLLNSKNFKNSEIVISSESGEKYAQIRKKERKKERKWTFCVHLKLKSSYNHSCKPLGKLNHIFHLLSIRDLKHFSGANYQCHKCSCILFNTSMLQKQIMGFNGKGIDKDRLIISVCLVVLHSAFFNLLWFWLKP